MNLWYREKTQKKIFSSNVKLSGKVQEKQKFHIIAETIMIKIKVELKIGSVE